MRKRRHWADYSIFTAGVRWMSQEKVEVGAKRVTTEWFVPFHFQPVYRNAWAFITVGISCDLKKNRRIHVVHGMNKNRTEWNIRALVVKVGPFQWPKIT